MFTGLVQHVGRLDQVAFQGDAGTLTVSAHFSEPLETGESIAINGACLTLVDQQGDRLQFDVLRETFDKTALGEKSQGNPLNLERAMRIGDPIGGHLVSGHVDGTGKLLRVEKQGRDHALVIHAPGPVAEMIPKGSIAVDGVSLTIVKIDSRAGIFHVHVIPHTWKETALSSLTAGMAVNLESDMIGKYVRSAPTPETPAQPTVTWAKLRDAGFVS